MHRLRSWTRYRTYTCKSMCRSSSTDCSVSSETRGRKSGECEPSSVCSIAVGAVPGLHGSMVAVCGVTPPGVFWKHTPPPPPKKSLDARVSQWLSTQAFTTRDYGEGENQSLSPELRDRNPGVEGLMFCTLQKRKRYTVHCKSTAPPSLHSVLQ